MKQILFFLILVVSVKPFIAQTTKTSSWRESERDSMAKAFTLYEDKNYSKALPYFENIYKNHPNEVFVKYMYGICSLYKSHKYSDALKMLQDVYEENPEIDLIEYDLARAFHYNYKFDEAIVMLDNFIANKRTTAEYKAKAEFFKTQLKNANYHKTHSSALNISNLGSNLNTSGDEYFPLISADESVLIYTYKGPKSKNLINNDTSVKIISENSNYTSDIFMSVKVNDQFQSPLPIDNINTTDDETAAGISQDAQVIYMFKNDTASNGDIYESRFNGTTYSLPSKLKGDVNTNSYEGHCSLTPDGKTLFFSSSRPGGLGGKDIYKAVLMPDSTWGDIVNMGDSINTSSDEDFPFIHYDGLTLFFCSNSQKSCGGYDIFKATIDRISNSISKVENAGFPINSPDDDVNFVLSANGAKGYYNSAKFGGEGLNDLYVVETGNEAKKPVLLTVKGNATFNDAPVEATIKIEIASKGNALFNIIKTIATTGNYMVSLPQGQSYKLTFSYKDQNPKIYDYNAIDITDYQEIVNDVKFGGSSDGNTNTNFDAKLPVADKAAITLLQKKISRYAAAYGKTSADGLVFKVQVAAIKVFDKSKFKNLKSLGKLETNKLEDGIIRVTSNGKFKTLEKAWEHNKKAIQAGQTDAFVTVYYQGKRVSLEELIKMGIYK